METLMDNKHYGRLAIMTILSFIFMYILMYAMVDVFGNIYANFNQFYMTGLMTVPMVILELSLMGMMYHNKKWNLLIIAGSVIVLILFFIFIRQQTLIGDKQFVRSMITHHASALLMCEEASIQDPEVKDLCQKVLSSQQEQIDQMKAILNRLEK